MNSKKAQASPLQIFYALSEHIRPENQLISNRNNRNIYRQYQVYHCLNTNWKKSTCELFCKNEKDFIDLFRQVRSCLADSGDNTMYEIYKDHRQKTQSNQPTFFEPNVSPRHKTMYADLLMIIMNIMPSSIVKMQNMRIFFTHAERFLQLTVQKNMPQITDLVKGRISEETAVEQSTEISGTRGCPRLTPCGARCRDRPLCLYSFRWHV